MTINVDNNKIDKDYVLNRIYAFRLNLLNKE